MRLLHVVTHPEVTVDPDVPVTDWSLSGPGLARAGLLAAEPWLGEVTHVFTSTERKAVQTAGVVTAAHPRLSPVQVEGLGENDRTATGYLPPAVFEACADEFFASPHRSVRGWETAAGAQRRMVAAVEHCLAGATGGGDVLLVTHGAVGTLLWCHLAGRPIERRHDQPGQGSHYAVDLVTGRPTSGWVRVNG